MQKTKMSLLMVLLFILFLAMNSVTAQEALERAQDRVIFFSTEEDFVAEIGDANQIISDGDLLNSAGYVYMRNLELLKRFNVSVDLGLDAADVIHVADRMVAFSTELNHPTRMFTAGDLLATNGAIVPNVALLAAFRLPRDLDLGLDAVHFTGLQDSVISFLNFVKMKGRQFWVQNPLILTRYLKMYRIDIWFSTEGTAPDRRSPKFLDGDLLSAAEGKIILSNHNALPITAPAGIPHRGVDFGMDAVTFYREQTGPKQMHCVDFEDLPLGTEYRVGDVFVDSDVTINVQRFQLINNQWAYNGFAKVDNAGRAGGSGQEIFANNVNLDFKFDCTCDTLTLLFGKYGGNLNIRINGAFKNFQNFVDLNGTTLGNVLILVASGQNKGQLSLVGKIDSFAIGGQELWIDHVCCCCPSAVILFSTEISGKHPPFTDGDILKAGNGVVIPHYDLIRNFKPKARFLGLDALSIVIAPSPKVCSNQITHIGGLKTHVVDIGTDGRADLWHPPADHPFGDHIPIWGAICDDVIKFRILYDYLGDKADYPTGTPIAVKWGDWMLKDQDPMLCCTTGWPVPWGTTDPNGWYDAVLYRAYRNIGGSCNCNDDLALTNWDTGPATNPNSLTPISPKVSDGLYAIWLEWETASGIDREPVPHNIMIDNSYPHIIALEIPAGEGHCPGFIGTNTTFMVRARFEDPHFWYYQLNIDGNCYPGTGYSYPTHNYYDGTPPPTNLDDKGTKPIGTIVDLHQVNIADVPPSGSKLKDCAYSVKLYVWDRTIVGRWTKFGGFIPGNFRSYVYDERYFTYKTSP